MGFGFLGGSCGKDGCGKGKGGGSEILIILFLLLFILPLLTEPGFKK